MNLAFYGTLRDPDILALVLGKDLISAHPKVVRIPGYRCERIAGEAYPLLRTDLGESTEFDLYHDVSVEVWRKLQEYEGEEYDHGTLDVGGKSYRVFLAKDSVMGSGEDWDLMQFQNRDKAKYIKELQ